MPENHKHSKQDGRVYLQYGCGLCAPESWINYDLSPMLIIRKIPLAGGIVSRKRNLVFPKNIRYGDIVKGFPAFNGLCDAVYCSHVLEHLTYKEFYIAINNTYKLLKKGGVFRLVMPDLKRYCEAYLQNSLDPHGGGGREASVTFMVSSHLGLERRRTFINRIISVFANSRHQWLWDYESTAMALKNAGFIKIRPCSYHDSAIRAFEEVENIGQFNAGFAVEAQK